MVFAASVQHRETAATRAGWFALWFAEISRALSQQMLHYARRELGLNLAEYRTLSVLAEWRSASVKDIAAGTQLDKAQITRAVANLTRRRIVVHAVDGRDRRLRVVKLTAAGRALAAKSLPFAVARQKRMERALTPTENRTLWKVLAVLSDEAHAMLAEETRLSLRGDRHYRLVRS
jgi:DNA-binding MarR family transcriptional regulator